MSLRRSFPFAISLGALTIGGGVFLVAACGDDNNDNPPGTSQFDSGTSTSSTSSSTSGSSGNFPNIDAGQSEVTVPTCVQKEADAIPGQRPVDIIFAIDNSDSMADEIAEVENQINQNFTSIVEASGVDYRVVMISKHGAHDGIPLNIQGICVKSPLSGTDCTTIPAKPAETAKFIHHNSLVNSNNAVCKILTALNGPDETLDHPQGYAPFLRPGAFKVFAVITDDRVDTACSGFTFNDSNTVIGGDQVSGTFDSALVALNPTLFGSGTERNYIFHSIIGVKRFDQVDTSIPHPPDAPIVLDKCEPGSVAPGTGYQSLSKLTGGLRFATCGLNYTSMFQEMAKGVVKKGVLACDYAMPVPDAGIIDPDTAVVRYTDGPTSKDTDFERSADAAGCATANNKFYIEGDRIKLCPATCTLVQADPLAKVKILFGCLPNGQTK